VLLEGPARIAAMRRLALVASAIGFVNLVAILGVWSFKRWGVYLAVSLGFLGAVVSYRLGHTANIVAFAAGAVLIAIAVGARWSEYD
jgi:uncharacterized membrane protein (DUF2068 family)